MGHPNETTEKNKPGVSPAPADAARSVTVNIDNESSLNLYLDRASLSHGAWSENLYPPSAIPARSKAQFAAESAGLATGVEGFVDYFGLSPNNPAVRGTVNLWFDNPFIGSNGYWVTVPYVMRYTTSGGGGNQATWSVTFYDA